MSSLKKYFIFLMLILIACSTEPISTGPYHYANQCDLNGVVYYDEIAYNVWCNPEGVKLYDSLKRESDFVKQFYVDERCIDNTIRYTLIYNTYTGQFQFMKSNGEEHFECDRGNIYVLGLQTISTPFFSGENYFQAPSRCVFWCGDNFVVDTIPSDFFTIDPVKSLENVTCEDKIAVVQSVYETSEKKRYLPECNE